MRVRATGSFVGIGPTGMKYRPKKGDEFDLPEGVDWLEAGLVEMVDQPKPKAKQTVKRRTRRKAE